ncbi:hypothetical protein SISSUDRAFT_1066449 [Sistotremastrum suecicum HHB10207 ss-3]|uniref:Uncharacterized protein n=1 Tax=Sistotremastrum suecicum HHB10207 ss-3 TaxID=1314776 RepID=A0A165YAN1_9AGAM|nr:hypothetical protein SISSUDRAFT_1066449 [Sistotremastrum suecicum HHB10207 ss-3]
MSSAPALAVRRSSRNPRVFTHGNGRLSRVHEETDTVPVSTARESTSSAERGNRSHGYPLTKLASPTLSSPDRQISSEPDNTDARETGVNGKNLRGRTPSVQEGISLHILNLTEALPDEARHASEFDPKCTMLQRGSQLFLRMSSTDLHALSQATSLAFSRMLNGSRHTTPDVEPKPLMAGSPDAPVVSGSASPAVLVLDSRFPDRADPIPQRKTYKGTQRSYQVWKENGVPTLGPEIRANRLAPRLDLAQPGDLYEIWCGDTQPAIWVMTQTRWCLIAVTDQHPIQGQYVLHYTPEGGPSWVLRETRAKYERNMARHK